MMLDGLSRSPSGLGWKPAWVLQAKVKAASPFEPHGLSGAAVL